ncbi:MerR family transcriptional regulator [Kibdelosporangium phytohabitans]|uniref:MerR family transcriptional regulator n=1 Tax=Kibdelosporangium phytohabitans TaxID=860235 RepID=UPI0019EDB0B6|nr:MerR family transcriptional regulator [Kibdelosporangium phytohabitans]MBE1467269.1 DNA-binding transcriptional MerR regulator [Kibdelosporangium phytohabitans]
MATGPDSILGIPLRGDVPEPSLPVAAVARRLGVAPSTLRTWDRRYGLGPRGHTTGRHRRYGPEDVARLELMQRALLRGASPAEAADYALKAHAQPGKPAPQPVVVPDESALARGLGRAALAMDTPSVQELLNEAIATDGVIACWDRVVRPVLTAVAGRWAHSGACVEVEHLLNECVLAAMIAATPLLGHARNPRPVLLSCAPEERHSLPLYVLRAALARREIGTQMLGAALPADALAAAVRRTAPAAVVLWAQLPRHGDPAVFERVPRSRQRIRMFSCGPGWVTAQLPDQVRRLDALADAVDQIEAVVVGART